MRETFANWWKQPLQMNGDALDWALFTGFILIIIFLWTRVLRDITEGIEV